jgi:hypothetical protein
MSNDIISPKIDLLQEQIENLVNSGHFTEKEIDSKSHPLRMELAILKHQKALNEFSNSVSKYGMSLESFSEGVRVFNECFAQMPKQPKKIIDIQVNEAETVIINDLEL